jgi:hypothetical protein
MKKILEILFRKMKPVKRSEVHPSLGRRGIVVPYDIPKVDRCKTCGK